MPTSHKKVIKNRTHGGDLCHTYFEFVRDDIDYVIIRRVILSKDHILFRKYSLLKNVFKDYGVYQQVVVLRLDALNELNNWIETLIK